MACLPSISFQSTAGQKQIFASLNQGAQANLFQNHIQGLHIALPPTKAWKQGSHRPGPSDADDLNESLEQLIAKKRHLNKVRCRNCSPARSVCRVSVGPGTLQLAKAIALAVRVSCLAQHCNTQGEGVPT